MAESLSNRKLPLTRRHRANTLRLYPSIWRLPTRVIHFFVSKLEDCFSMLDLRSLS
jgi:hypothetical protein